MWNIWENALHIVIAKYILYYYYLFCLRGRGKFDNCVTLSDFGKGNKVY